MFPFDQPPETAFYLAWYWLTLVLHVVPMNYVLGGATYLAIHGLAELVGGAYEPRRAIAAKLRDWLPFALGVAITAAVAPLLFLQILYKRAFYTANLLLFHRWMAILPVLIVAFYLLYLQKSKLWHDRPAWARAAVSLGIALCFAFTAWSWTENHLLSLRDQAFWTAEYASGSWFYIDDEMFPRLAVWFIGAFPTMAMLLAWQFRADADAPPTAARTLADLALSSMAGAIAAGIGYAMVVPKSIANRLFTNETYGLLTVVVIGLVVQAVVWIWIRRSQQWTKAKLIAATAGCLTAISAAVVVRELRRTASIDLAALAERHQEAFGRGGIGVFLVFLIVNAAVIVGIGVLLVRGLRAKPVEKL